jgi:uncharacterized protein (TIGR00251 family)
VADVSDLFSIEGEAVVLRVHVQPRAGRSAVVGRHGDALKVHVAAPPVDDRANAEIVELVAELFEVAKQKVTIISGDRSRLKRVRVTGVETDDVEPLVRRALESASSPDGPRRRRVPE